MADDSLERITILLQANDREFARAMERNNKLVAKFAREAGQGTTAATRSIDANLARAGASAINFGKSFVTGLAVGAITAVLAEVSGSIRDVIGELADLQDTADRINMGVEEMQALQYGMKLAGVQTAEFSKGMEKFTENIGDAARGSGPLRDVLAANGIAIKDMSGAIRPTADILRDFADLIKRTPDEAERMSLVTEAFGKGGKAMVLALAQGSFGMNQMEQDAYSAGAVMKKEVISKAVELDDKFDALTTRVGIFFKTIVVNTADAVAQIGNVASAADEAMILSVGGNAENIIPQEGQSGIQRTGEMSDEARQKAQQLKIELYAMADAANVASEQLLETAAQLRLVGDEAGADRLQALAAEMNRVAAEFVNGKISGEKFQQELRDVISASQDAVHGLDAVDGVSFGSVIARLGGLWTALQNVATKAREAAAAMPGGSPGFESGGRGSPPRTPNTAPPSFESGGRSGSTSAPYVAPAQTLQDIIDRNAGHGGAGRGGGASDRMNDQQREAARLFEQTRTEAEKYAAELLELNELLADGYIDQDLYARGLDQIKEKYGEAGGAAEFFKNTSDDLKEAFLDLAIDGVDSFDAIAKSIKRAALEALLFGSGPLSGLFGGKPGGGGGGFLSGLANLFKGKRAAGGSVTAGGAYMVGERGPELYVPGASGAIVPHSKISGGGAQGPLSVLIGFDQTIGSITAMVRDEAGRVVAMATPQIVSQSVGAVVSMSKKTKSALS